MDVFYKTPSLRISLKQRMADDPVVHFEKVVGEATR